MTLLQANKIKFFIFFIICNLTLFYPTKSYSKNDYCSFNVDNLPANVIIIDTLSLISSNGDLNEEAIKIFQSGFKSIKDNTSIGQKLIIYKYTKDGSPQRIFDQCRPECPETSVLERIVGGTCNKGEELGDIKNYGINSNNAVVIAIKEAKKNLTKENNIISKISSLSNEFSQLSKNDNIYIYSNLVENSNYGDFSTSDENEFHKAFVMSILDKKVPKNYGENVTFYGAESSMLIIEFWNDLISVYNNPPTIYSNLLN